MSTAELSLDLHERYRGIIEIQSKVPIRDTNTLSDFYLPPLAALPPEEIRKNRERVFDLTCKKNLVAVVSDGSAVLGLGNIGPWAALPVMEGKSALFHSLAGVEAFPLCLATQEPDELVRVVKNISPVLGGVNLEDISAPRCFEIEERLKAELDIPVFHDDQHGTAVVVLGALINALKLAEKEIEKIRVVISGAGAAAIAISKLLISRGVTDLTLCDRQGPIYAGRGKGMNTIKDEMAKVTNPSLFKGTLSDAIRGSDVFVGVSGPGLLTPEDIKSMGEKPIVFALANPTPEIMPDVALKEGGFIVATGRSDFPNQVNNSLVFPGIFRGALDVRVTDINDEMKIAAAEALAGLVEDGDLQTDCVIPKGLDYRVPPVIAEAVAQAAVRSGVSGITVDEGFVRERTKRFIYEGELD
ncbi:MAG: NADP-dependent malic enzyme [Nitrospinota bacterium]